MNFGNVLAALIAALLAMPTPSLAQSRTFYDRAGRVVAKSSTDRQGTTTYYDRSGRVTARSTQHR